MAKDKIIKYKGEEINLSQHIKGQKWHNDKVFRVTKALAEEAIKSAKKHDKEKLGKDQVEVWARFQLIEKGKPAFGTQEYFDMLETYGVNEVRSTHKKNNRHHPEYFNRDFSKMNLVDLLELASDWYTANTYRPTSIDEDKMLDFMQKKYGFSDDLKAIIKNTFNKLKELKK